MLKVHGDTKLACEQSGVKDRAMPSLATSLLSGRLLWARALLVRSIEAVVRFIYFYFDAGCLLLCVHVRIGSVFHFRRPHISIFRLESVETARSCSGRECNQTFTKKCLRKESRMLSDFGMSVAETSRSVDPCHVGPRSLNFKFNKCLVRLFSNFMPISLYF